MKPLLLACTLAVAISAIAADKPNSTKVTGTVLTPKAVKDYSGLTLSCAFTNTTPSLPINRPTSLPS